MLSYAFHPKIIRFFIAGCLPVRQGGNSTVRYSSLFVLNEYARFIIIAVLNKYRAIYFNIQAFYIFIHHPDYNPISSLTISKSLVFLSRYKLFVSSGISTNQSLNLA